MVGHDFLSSAALKVIVFEMSNILWSLYRHSSYSYKTAKIINDISPRQQRRWRWSAYYTTLIHTTYRTVVTGSGPSKYSIYRDVDLKITSRQKISWSDGKVNKRLRNQVTMRDESQLSESSSDNSLRAILQYLALLGKCSFWTMRVLAIIVKRKRIQSVVLSICGVYAPVTCESVARKLRFTLRIVAEAILIVFNFKEFHDARGEYQPLEYRGQPWNFHQMAG